MLLSVFRYFDADASFDTPRCFRHTTAIFLLLMRGYAVAYYAFSSLPIFATPFRHAISAC